MRTDDFDRKAHQRRSRTAFKTSHVVLWVIVAITSISIYAANLVYVARAGYRTRQALEFAQQQQNAVDFARHQQYVHQQEIQPAYQRIRQPMEADPTDALARFQQVQEQTMEHLLAEQDRRRHENDPKPVPAGYRCIAKQLFRELPNGFEQVTDGSASLYCR